MNMMDLAGTAPSENDKGAFIATRGFIDARNDKGVPIYAAFLSVSGFQRTLFIKVFFSNDPISKDLTYSGIASLGDPGMDELEHFINELTIHIRSSRILEFGRGVAETKENERKISHFCTESLGISALVFMDERRFENEDALLAEMPFLAHGEEEKEDRTDAQDAEDTEDNEHQETADEGEGESGSKDREGTGDIFLACKPILDVINGSSIRDLREGDGVTVELSKASAYYEFLSAKLPNFDGSMNGTIRKIDISGSGAVVAVDLAEGVIGAMRISENVKLKRPTSSSSTVSPAGGIAPEAIFIIVSVIACIAVLAIILLAF